MAARAGASDQPPMPTQQRLGLTKQNDQRERSKRSWLRRHNLVCRLRRRRGLAMENGKLVA
jgi:hypothetical protein